MPRVSIVVPIYNNAHYLRECLDSAAAQTLSDIEVICVNDGSKDDSLAIMQEYAERDARFAVIDKPNTGYGDSVNCGLDRARGEYATILESDDLLPPDACERMYRFAVDNGGLDFLKADAQTFLGEGDERTFALEPASTRRICYEGVFCPADDPGRYFGRNGQPGLYRISFLRERGVRHNASPGASFQDAGFWALAMCAGRRVRYLDEVCYLIRRDNPASSQLGKGNAYAICREYEYVRRAVAAGEGFNVPRCLAGITYVSFINYMWTCGRIDLALVREFLNHIAAEFRERAAVGEVDRAHFSDEEYQTFEAVMNNPDAFYFEHYHYRDILGGLRWDKSWLENNKREIEAENAALRAQIDALHASWRYRIGTAVTAPARLFRRGGAQ